MKNVLLIGSELGKGGAERSISLLSYYLEQRGYYVILCILSGRDRAQYYPTCKKVIFVDPPVYNNYLNKISAWKFRLKRIKKIKEKFKIDVSISFLEGPDYVNLMTRGTEKVVLSIRGSKMFDKVISGVSGIIRKKLLIPYFYKRADEIVCVSEALRAELHKYFGIDKQKLTTIYNFYENDVIVDRSHEPICPEAEKIFTKPVVITSGRLHISKAQDSLVRILKKVKQQMDVRLMILGDGELKDYLMRLADSMGLTVCDWGATQRYSDADIYLMGYQANAFKYYRRSSLFALSSSWEGFPNVFAEALICKIPVVSTDCYTGPREILNVTDLGGAPVEEAHRTKIGSLLPMLDRVDERRFNIWTQEIVHWLKQDKPSDAEFDKLTERFSLNDMLGKWEKVIEKES
jgi:glycosyltransferase involved in cell wall biosynthesis